MRSPTSRYAPARRRAVRLLAVGALGLSLALAGCSAHSGNDSTGSSNAQPAAAQPDTGKAAGGAAEKAAPPNKAGNQILDPAEVPASGKRDVIYTGTITVRVSNVDDKANALTGLAEGAGGYIAGDERTSDSARSAATVVVRVAADKFTSTLDAISHLGTEEHRQLAAQDVTAQLVDLDSRIKTQQASVDRIRALLAQAQTIAEITSVEGELTRREADLESLKAQQAALAGQATLSTITVILLGPEAVTDIKPRKKTGFLHGLASGWHAFTASLQVLVTVLGALLPFALAIGVPLWLVLWFFRRRARLHPAPALAVPSVHAPLRYPAAPPRAAGTPAAGTPSEGSADDDQAHRPEQTPPA
jgi:hypothetical protein